MEDCDPIADLHINKLRIESCLKRGEECIKGSELRERARRRNGVLGVRDGQQLLDHQDQIPMKMRKKKIVLTGTTLLAPNGFKYTASLCWYGGDNRWDFDFTFANGLWVGYECLPCREQA
ncbi:MAG: hypothetical protein WCV83_02530 [Candidatus Magasanikbacteria bacterium]